MQIILRRAALFVRNAGSIVLDDKAEEALRDLCGDARGRHQYIVREWMEKNTYLPAHDLDEDGELDGTA
jgi:hypothetical protein